MEKGNKISPEDVLIKHTRIHFAMTSNIYAAKNSILRAMEEYAELARSEEREKTIKDCQDVLLKQLHTMVYENGYPIEGVAKATILMLDKLVSPSEKGEGRKGE